jgi:hypothetical protein
MKIILSPLASNKTTSINLTGLILTIDGTEYDLSVIPEGGQAEADAPFIGIVTRDCVTIQYQYDSMKAEPNQSTDWADYTFEITDGDVPCPIKWLPITPETTLEESTDV